MLMLLITLGRKPRAAEFKRFWLMLVGSPSRAVMIGSNSILRSQRGPGVRYWMADVKLFGRSNPLTARSTLRNKLGNWPWSKASGCEKLNRPEPSSMDLDLV